MTDEGSAAPSAPPARRDRRWLWWLLLAWLAVSALLIANGWRTIGILSLPDTDDNMRLQQVRDWLAGQGWSDLRQHRMLWPEGADIHWSRLVDLPLAGLILLARAVGAPDLAERFAVAVAPLFPLLVAMAAVAGIVRRTIAPAVWILGPALLMCAHSALGMLTPLRIDHHGWQIAFVLVMVLGLLMRRPALGGTIAGLCVGLSLAIGVETLPYLGLGGVIAAAAWVLDERDGDRFAAFGAAAAGSTALAYLVFITPANRAQPWCDVLSDVWLIPVLLGGAGAMLVTRFAVARRGARLALVVLVGAVAAAYVLGLHPACVLDPYSAVDPEARRIWLDNVREARPVYEQSLFVQTGVLSLPVAGLIGAAAALWRDRHDGDVRWRWTVVTAFTLFGVALAFTQTRAGIMAQALAVPGAAMLTWMLLQWARSHDNILVRVLGSVAAFMIVSGLAGQWLVKAIPDSDTKRSATFRRTDALCAVPVWLKQLDRYPPGVMLTFIDLSPRIIVHSHQRPLIGPYHRNGKAIADVMESWIGTPDTAREIARRYGVVYVMTCPGTSESSIYTTRGPDGFYARLEKGEVPAWLTPLPLPKAVPYRLYRITG